ncbi:MAG: peptide deformylase [Candidatus Saccharimonadales bacterium]
MKFRPIITLPGKNLRQRSIKVGFIDEDVTRLVEEMKAATLDWEDNRPHEVGVALAAVQIDDLRRVIIIRNNFDNKEDREFKVFINPEVTKYEGEIEEDYEGCLSVKDIYGKVPRHTKVRVKALSLDGQEVRVKATGFLARVFQHEIDHINGLVFIDHIKDKKESFYKLTDKGKLEKLDYDESIAKNSLLW